MICFENSPNPVSMLSRVIFAGEFVYLTTLYEDVGNQATLTLPVVVGSTTSCLQFHYSMVSNGSLSVRLTHYTSFIRNIYKSVYFG